MRSLGGTRGHAAAAMIAVAVASLGGGCLLTIPFDALDDSPDAGDAQSLDVVGLDTSLGEVGGPCETPCPMGTCRADLGGGSSACEIATSLRKPRLGLSVDTKNAYWTTLCGELQKKPLGGGATETLYTRDGAVFGGLATDGVSATWADKKNRVVFLMPLSGAAGLTTIVPPADASFTTPIDVAIGHSGSIYWLGGYDVWSVARDGGVPGTPVELVRSTGPSAALAVREPRVGWALAGRDGLDAGGVRTFDLDAGEEASTPLFDGPSTVRVITVDEARWYWGSDDGTISTAAYGGGPVRVIARDQGTPNGIAVDEGFAYWTTRGSGTDGTLRRANKFGSADATNAVTTYVTGRAFPAQVVVTSAYIYWLDEGADDPTSCADPAAAAGSVERVNK
ncbi:MAG: hypothetical protein ACHREM_12725 [Polyangiales bacterium]